MTDNRTTDLREKLDELGIEHFDYDKGGRTQTQWEAPDGKRHFMYQTSNNLAKTARLVIAWHPTPEQAIAATLGSDNEYEAKMDALLCRLTNGKWSKSYAYSLDFMVSCIDEEYEELYEKERAELGNGTLTAEQVREAVMSADRWEKPMGSTGLTNTHLIIRDDGWQAIADELNATVGQGTCIPHGEWERLSQTQEFRRMYCDCGYELGMDSRDSFPFERTAYAAMPRFCPECGVRIVSKGEAVER